MNVNRSSEQTKQYLDFSSTGSGTHSFNYQDISVSVEGKIGISSIGSETFEAQIQPIFRGSVTSVHLSNQGVGYGSSEIVNFNRPPTVRLVSGKNAQLSPIISNGEITDVIILNGGTLYNSSPDLTVTGDGIGAVLTPILSDGVLTSVKVVSGGAGYTDAETSITIGFPGAEQNYLQISKTGEPIYSRNILMDILMMMVLLDLVLTIIMDHNTLTYTHQEV